MVNRLAENACTHDRSRRSKEMQKDRRSFLSSEFVRALAGCGRHCTVLFASELLVVCGGHTQVLYRAVTYSVMRRLRTTGVLGFTRRFLPFPRASSHFFRDASPFLSLPPASLVSSVTVSS